MSRMRKGREEREHKSRMLARGVPRPESAAVVENQEKTMTFGKFTSYDSRGMGKKSKSTENLGRKGYRTSKAVTQRQSFLPGSQTERVFSERKQKKKRQSD